MRPGRGFLLEVMIAACRLLQFAFVDNGVGKPYTSLLFDQLFVFMFQHNLVVGFSCLIKGQDSLFVDVEFQLGNFPGCIVCDALGFYFNK